MVDAVRCSGGAQLRAALSQALRTADRLGRLRAEVDVEVTASHLALLAYGVNLRSRAGAPATELKQTMTETLAALTER